jgi:hypothetical protein
VADDLEPRDVAGADLEGGHVRLDGIDGLEVVRAREVVHAVLATALGEQRRPVLGHARVLVDLEHRLPPRRLVRDLRAELLETAPRDDLGCDEVLELDGVRARLGGELDQAVRAVQAAVVVGSDVGDEVERLARADPPV